MDREIRKKTYTPRQAKLKLENYCAYQERSQQEVRDKLYDMGLHENEVENIIADLISENFLNEERFVKAYVSGKFKIKHWGKIKIIQHLKLKKISNPLIKIGLQEIEYDEYIQTIKDTIGKKIKEYNIPLSYQDKAKLVRYVQSKGFENELIFEELNNLHS